MTYSYFVSVVIASGSPSSPDVSDMASQGSVDETAPELLNSQDPFFPLLVDCTHPIESIAARLTTKAKWLVHSLHTVEARMMVQSKVVGRCTKLAVCRHCFVMYV
jgi:hypothetical protein